MNTRDVEMMSAANANANANGHGTMDHDLEKSEDRLADRDRNGTQVPDGNGLGVVDNGSSVDFSLKGVLRLGVESRGTFCYLLRTLIWS